MLLTWKLGHQLCTEEPKSKSESCQTRRGNLNSIVTEKTFTSRWWDWYGSHSLGLSVVAEDMDYKREKLGGEGFSLAWGLPLQEAKKDTSVLWGIWVNLVWQSKPRAHESAAQWGWRWETKCSLVSAEHVEKYNFPQPLRSLKPLVIPQGGDVGHSLSWTRGIGGAVFREVTLSRRLPCCTTCTGALLVLLLFLGPGEVTTLCGSSHTAGAQIQLWFCQKHTLL